MGAVTCLFLGSVLSPTAQETRLLHWQSPLGLPARYGGFADLVSAVGVLLALITSVGAISGLVIRWRRGGPLVRQQLLLLALAACPPAAPSVSSSFSWARFLGGSSPLRSLPLPVAIGIATGSYGLYDLRRGANRTLLWVTMSGTVVGIYAVVVFLRQRSSPTITPDGFPPSRPGSPPWPSSPCANRYSGLSTASSMDAGMSRTKCSPASWASAWRRADVDRLLDASVTELTSGLDLRDVSVRSVDGTAVAGAAAAAGITVPLQAYGATVGWLAYRPPERQLSTAELRLVRDLARQLGGAMHARALRQDLQRARERLVFAREEERRRLRRDLHDGIGPALAGLRLKTETALALLPPGADAASRQLQSLSDEIHRMVVDVRRVVEGLRPPALDELGLVGVHPSPRTIDRRGRRRQASRLPRTCQHCRLLWRLPPTASWSRQSPTSFGTQARAAAR